METRLLGRTGLRVSALGMGTWPLAGALTLAGRPFGYGESAPGVAEAALETALDSGVTLFDTADFYGLGRAERLLAQRVAKDPRALIVTKAGNVPDNTVGVMTDVSRPHLLASVRRSLKRLGRERVEVFLLHVLPEGDAAWDEALDTLAEMKAAGLIAHGGVSVAHRFDDVLPRLSDTRIEVVEVYYNLFFNRYRGAFSQACARHDVGVIGASPLGRGLLSSSVTMDRRFDEGDVRSAWNTGGAQFQDDLARRDRVAAAMAGFDVSLSAAALAFVLAEPTIATVIPGMRTSAQVANNVADIAAACGRDDLLVAMSAVLDGG